MEKNQNVDKKEKLVKNHYFGQKPKFGRNYNLT